MDLITVVGLAASTGTGISLLPQLIKIAREKKAEDISLLMVFVLAAGLALWIWYGVMKDDWIIIVSNSFSLLVNTSIAVLSLIYKKDKKLS